MEWLVLVVVLVAAFYYFVIVRAGNISFWKAVNKHQNEALMFFLTSPNWHINRKPIDRAVSGPYFFVDPRTGQTLKLYCDEYQEHQTQD